MQTKHARMIQELCDLEAGLTGWELDFIESMANIEEVDGDLSDKQIETLERIYDERT